MILVCRCGAANRLPSEAKVRLRCGKCKREWTPTELAGARPEAPPTRPAPDDDFDLEREDDVPLLTCACGWEGDADDAEENDDGDLTCPDCEKKLRVK